MLHVFYHSCLYQFRTVWERPPRSRIVLNIFKVLGWICKTTNTNPTPPSTYSKRSMKCSTGKVFVKEKQTNLLSQAAFVHKPLRAKGTTQSSIPSSFGTDCWRSKWRNGGSCCHYRTILKGSFLSIMKLYKLVHFKKGNPPHTCPI